MKHDFTQYLMYTPYFRLFILQAVQHNKQCPETKNQRRKIGNNLIRLQIGIFQYLVKGMLQARVNSEILGLPRPRYTGFSLAYSLSSWGTLMYTYIPVYIGPEDLKQSLKALFMK